MFGWCWWRWFVATGRPRSRRQILGIDGLLVGNTQLDPIAWRSTKSRLNIPAGQIVGPGRVTDGLAEVVDIVGEPELAWAFLDQEWPFDDGVARPIERLRSGGLDEVLSAASGFGSTFA